MNTRIALIGLCVLLAQGVVVGEGPTGALPGSAAPVPAAVLLRWRVPPEAPLVFRTAMAPVRPGAKGFLKIDAAELLEGAALDPKLAQEMTQEMVFPSQSSMFTVLRALPDENISVKMIVEQISADGGAMADAMKAMEGTVQLRGRITPAGRIASWWLEQKQKNLLALFTELPTKTVRVGDTWSLQTSLVEVGHGFVCDESDYSNQVRLAALEKAGDDKVAVIDYSLAESVVGKFVMPIGPQAGRAQPFSMSMIFVGRGEFLVGKGSWRKFAGRMEIKGSGMMQADVQQQFLLVPSDEIPAALLSLE